jgi:hypothetical protein
LFRGVHSAALREKTGRAKRYLEGKGSGLRLFPWEDVRPRDGLPEIEILLTLQISLPAVESSCIGLILSDA